MTLASTVHTTRRARASSLSAVITVSLGAMLTGAMLTGAMLVLSGCTFKKAPLGTEDNPIKLFFVPSVEAKTLNATGKAVEAYLEAHTPYKFSIHIPTNYIAVVEAFGSKQCDVAALNTFGYIRANEKYGAEARLTVLRHGSSTYQGQFLARAEDPIDDIKDLEGKKFAFVDAASTSGYILPVKMIKDAGVKLSETVFAMKHDNVVAMIIQKQVDAGATYYSPPDEEGIQDARRLVKAAYPDVEKQVKIVKLTEAIPNDPIVFRKGMPEEMKVKIIDAFMAFIATPEGKKAFKAVYGIDQMQKATDKDYDQVREMLKAIGRNDLRLITQKKK